MSETKPLGVAEPETPEKGKTFLELALEGTVILTAITGLLYLVGWVYLEELYDKFGLDLWMLDFPAYTPLLYSVVSVPWWFRFSCFIAFCAIVGMLVAPYALFKRLRRWQIGVALPVLLLAAVIVMVAKSVHLADKQADEMLACSYQVHLTFLPEKLVSEDSTLKEANESGNLRLLTQTKDLVIVFEKPESQSKPSTKSMFVLKRSDLSSVHFSYPPVGHRNAKSV